MPRGPKAIPATDRLYQLPLNEFIAVRNALAKEAGADGAAIRALQKPNVPAWAVNQLYWRKRPIYDELVSRAEDLRATHLAALRGQRADLRGAGKEHEAAVEAALRATLALLAEEGQPVTDLTRQAIATTLRGLPGDEPAGRLTRPLEPRGFEMLTGVASGGRVKAAAVPAVKPATAKGKSDSGRRADKTTAAAVKTRAREKLAEAREALTVASRAVRIAEQAARREEFEAARAVRDAEKVQRRVGEAEAAVTAAQAALAEAERDAAAANEERDAAQERAAAATADLEAARDAEKQARAAVERASGD